MMQRWQENQKERNYSNMNGMYEHIAAFISNQSSASICCIDEQDKPYCFSCFYAFSQEEGLLYFKSSAHSRHAVLLNLNHCIAGTILPDKLNKLHIKGIQFEGQVLRAENPLVKKSLTNYLRKHPVALAMPGEVWTIQLDNIKMTDSTLGFGKKISWQRGEDIGI